MLGTVTSLFRRLASVASPAIIVCLITLLLGCSQPESLPSAPTPTPAFDLNLEASATRNNPGMVLVNLEDTSQQGLEVLLVERANVDKCLGEDGNQIAARLKTFGWKIGEGSDAAECFQLLLVMTGRIPNKIAQLEGTFVVAHGESEELTVGIEDAASKLAEYSIEVNREVRTTIELELRSDNLTGVGKIALESNGKLIEGGNSSFTSGGELRGLGKRWNVAGTPTEENKIQIWKKDSSASTASIAFVDGWTGDVAGFEGVAGQMRATEMVTVRLSGSRTALLNIKPELNGQAYDAKIRRARTGDREEFTMLLGPEWRDVKLVVTASKNAEFSTCAFSSSDLDIQ